MVKIKLLVRDSRCCGGKAESVSIQQLALRLKSSVLFLEPISQTWGNKGDNIIPAARLPVLKNSISSSFWTISCRTASVLGISDAGQNEVFNN